MFFHIVGNILIRRGNRVSKFHCELHSPCVIREKLVKLAEGAVLFQRLGGHHNAQTSHTMHAPNTK